MTSPRATVLISSSSEGVTRAERHGGTWHTETLLPDRDVRCVADGRDGVVWAGTQSSGLFRSDDAGHTWRSSGLAGSPVKVLAPSPHDQRVIFAGLKPAAVAVSRDGGASWSELRGFRRIRGRRLWFSPAEPPGSAYVQGLDVSPTDPDVLVAGIEFGAVVRSQDGAKSWSGHRKGAIRDCHSLTFHATQGNRVYEAGAGFRRRPLAMSRDGGLTWSSPASGNEAGYGWACAADPSDADTVYLSAARGPGKAHGRGPAEAFIYRSKDGRPWESLGGGLPTPLAAMPYALVTDPLSPGHLYAGMRDGQVWFTPDHGDTWSRLDVDLGSVERTLAILWGAP